MLLDGEAAVGALMVARTEAGENFDENHLNSLSTLATLAGVARHNADRVPAGHAPAAAADLLARHDHRNRNVQDCTHDFSCPRYFVSGIRTALS